ncbi:MAG: TRAP transporter substrate-binding protein, partial [Bacteroidales bacterium]|nr:TRAP transporter substrate-binding protein [Bacteroidales bacterium]
ALADQHFRVMTSNKKVQELSDLKGIKIRTMENSHHITFWKALGANPTPMAFSELYVGLEQHTVDAQENPYEVICSNGFYEVQKYVIETNHLPHLLALVTNQEFYQKMPKESQKIINQAAIIARDEARKQAVLRTSDKVKEIENGGAELVPVSEAFRESMLKASEPLYQQISKIVNDNELMELYISNNK